MSDVKLGQLITDDQQRDAVHVAVAPVKAGHTLAPGQHVSVREGMAYATGNHIGVVDPYLRQPVLRGESFWLCLVPQTTLGLRHHWTHPDFTDDPSRDPEGESQRAAEAATGDKAASEVWLKNYVRAHCPYWEDELDFGYAEFLRYVRDERWIYYYGSDCHGLNDVEDADELFRHLSVVLGIRIDAAYFETFTCSC